MRRIGPLTGAVSLLAIAIGALTASVYYVSTMRRREYVSRPWVEGDDGWGIGV